MLKKSLGIYIHVPFCKSKCPYCDFYSLSNFTSDYVEKYILTVCSELRKWGSRLENKVVDTVYIGGGTPSVLSSEQIIKILTSVKENFHFGFLNEYPEITLEVNPADYDKIDFEKLNYYGINRVSIGAQSLNNSNLKILGRRHNTEDIFKSVLAAEKSKINNVSLDIILGAPYQEKKDVYDFFCFCKENDIPHVSSYLLKIEDGTPFYFNKEKYKFFDDDEYADIYFYACDLAKKMGYGHYEISNFAFKGFESRHNLKYWNLDEYLGIGPSAHSLVENKRFYYPKDLAGFINFPKTIFECKFEPEKEFVMLKLRTSKGLNNDEFKYKFGKDIPQKYFQKAEKFAKYGFLKIDDKNISLNEKGFLVSNYIISEII